MEILHTIATWIVSGFVLLGLFTPPSLPPQAPVENLPQTATVYPVEPTVGAALPQQDALIDTYLASDITKTATTMTLAKGTTRDGATISGYYCFTIDINSSTLEYACGTAAGTSVTALNRGIKASNPNATSSSLAYAHRRYSSVQVTDFPFNQLVQRRMNGIDPLESMLYYTGISTSTISASSTNVIPTKGYVDFVATGGCANADSTTRGCIEYATQIEAASSTVFGSTGARLGITAEMSTSSPGSSGIWGVVTGNSGKIQSSFLNGNTEQYTFNGATTTIAGATAIATSTQFGVYGGLAPVGSLIAYASTTAPKGWLLADGSSLLRSAYPQLFQVLGTSYGAADGTHFTLPNLLGRTPVMASTTANIGQSGGEDRHTQTIAEMPAHDHTVPFTPGAGSPNNITGAIGNGSTPASTVNSGSTGGGTAFNVRDPYLAVQYIIKY